MIAELEHLKANNISAQMSDAMQAFGINNKIKQGFMALFASYLYLEQRI